MSSAPNVDVVVVGAGLAGLTAARGLRAAGVDCVVLEARERVGGRTLNVALQDGTPIEIGGQWAGHDHTEVMGLAAALGIEVFAGHLDGDHQFWDGANLSRFRAGDSPLTNLDDARALDSGIEQLEAVAAALDPSAPWEHPAATTLDRVTFDEWLRQHVSTATAAQLLRAMVESLTATPPWHYSALHAAFMIAMAGGFDELFAPEMALRFRFVGGSQEISVRAADELDRAVRLNSAVAAIDIADDANSVSVTTSTGDRVVCRRVVLAVPPALIGALRVTPGLPGAVAQLAQRMPPGSVIKFLASYPKPFWRDTQLSGWTNTAAEPLFDVLDNSPADGHLGVLTSFAVGDAARQLAALDHVARRRTVLDRFADFYGEPARNPTEFHELDWTDEPWTRGGYQANPTLGTWTLLGPTWVTPCGPLHFAGAERSSRFYGHMEGAVRSGHRAAAEVIASLR
jgi:monoamine oxidase